MVGSNDRTSSLLQSIDIRLLVTLTLGKGHPPNLPQRGCRLVKFLKFIDRSSDSYIGRDNYFVVSQKFFFQIYIYFLVISPCSFTRLFLLTF